MHSFLGSINVPIRQRKKSTNSQYQYYVSTLEWQTASNVEVSGQFVGNEAELAIDLARSLGIPILEDSTLCQVISAMPVGQIISGSLLGRIVALLQHLDDWFANHQK